ncbi:hypothetical protein [Algisphaera agarilytica]|uniref:Uncharacterized protein n=1 Tax=Algisphaera agarilytica TaxID=1385975 RepID=A0A7X0H911_9BACT|nr:hypothetical protein [Algisphaera agarilytica]MBB6431495.1 hypothetical protein [Algisphaera agarilytica]
MSWFQKACRNLGLTVHNVVKPVQDHQKTTVRKTVEEKQLDTTTTLRRTTIEEIEITPRKDDSTN